MAEYNPDWEPKRVSCFQLIVTNHDVPETQYDVSKAKGWYTLHSREELIIDRATQTLTYTQQLGTMEMRKRFFVDNWVEELLDEMEEVLCTPDVPSKPRENLPSYELLVVYEDQEFLQVQGIYDQLHLPEDWQLRNESIGRFVREFAPYSTLFNPQIRVSNDDPQDMPQGAYLYCGVQFSQAGQIYHYRTDDATLQAGDWVIVPVGNTRERVAYVADIQSYAIENVPYPIELTKWITGRAERLQKDKEKEGWFPMAEKTIAIRYQSRGGNTKAVAEVIAKATGGKAEPISVPINEPVDILFIGGGVYAWDIDKMLKACLQTLTPAMVKSVAVFTTGGAMDKTGRIAELLKAQGITVCEETLPVKLGLRNHGSLGGKGVITLKDTEIAAIEDFVKRVVE